MAKVQGQSLQKTNRRSPDKIQERIDYHESRIPDEIDDDWFSQPANIPLSYKLKFLRRIKKNLLKVLDEAENDSQDPEASLVLIQKYMFTRLCRETNIAEMSSQTQHEEDSDFHQEVFEAEGIFAQDVTIDNNVLDQVSKTDLSLNTEDVFSLSTIASIRRS
ncbi:hypothetical protein POTOM_019726 [Populus tomentosa]|uniref:Uncharacterized protein n=1 Tax=Populus tomentosa TaxID=118781 RepID=A0A8X7ZW60_POPTO|nr:hypothetical protein POTOM_019726 [Populus tomentosa]